MKQDFINTICQLIWDRNNGAVYMAALDFLTYKWKTDTLASLIQDWVRDSEILIDLERVEVPLWSYAHFILTEKGDKELLHYCLTKGVKQSDIELMLVNKCREMYGVSR